MTQKFDWTFGVGLPLVCVAADPIVFNGPQSLLGDYQVFAYILSAASIMSMAAWLLWGDRLGWLRPFLGGFFITGSVISGLVGLPILPYSLIGMFLLIGFLGFTPLFSAFIYLRSGYMHSKVPRWIWIEVMPVGRRFLERSGDSRSHMF